MPIYTYLLSGLFYQLLVLKVMLLTRKTLAQMCSPVEETEARKRLAKREEMISCLTHGLIWFAMTAAVITFGVDYGFNYDTEVNNLNRVAILAWTSLICMILLVSSICLLCEMDKHYSRSAQFVRYTRIRVSFSCYAPNTAFLCMCRSWSYYWF